MVCLWDVPCYGVLELLELEEGGCEIDDHTQEPTKGKSQTTETWAEGINIHLWRRGLGGWRGACDNDVVMGRSGRVGEREKAMHACV